MLMYRYTLIVIDYKFTIHYVCQCVQSLPSTIYANVSKVYHPLCMPLYVVVSYCRKTCREYWSAVISHSELSIIRTNLIARSVIASSCENWALAKWSLAQLCHNHYHRGSAPISLAPSCLHCSCGYYCWDRPPHDNGRLVSFLLLWQWCCLDWRDKVKIVGVSWSEVWLMRCMLVCS